jgi:hypothetical protein
MPKSENAIAFAFLKFNANKGAAVPKSFRWGPSELIGFDARLTPKTKWLNQIEFIQNFDQHFSTIAGPIFDYKSGLSWSLKKDFELRFLADYGVLSTSTNFLTATFAASFYL